MLLESSPFVLHDISAGGSENNNNNTNNQQNSRIFRVFDQVAQKNTQLVLKTAPHPHSALVSDASAVQNLHTDINSHAQNSFRTVSSYSTIRAQDTRQGTLSCSAYSTSSTVEQQLLVHQQQQQQRRHLQTQQEHPLSVELHHQQQEECSCTFYCSMIHSEWQVVQSLLPHRNIVSVYDCYRKTRLGCCALLMEAAEMDLFDFVQKQYWQNRRTHIHRVLDLYRQVAQGLDFLHCADFAHNDIKSENVLLFNNARLAKISDFGLATKTIPKSSSSSQRLSAHESEQLAHKQAENWSMRCLSHAAPEIIETLVGKKKPFDEQAADVFAFGVSLFESVFGIRPVAERATNKDKTYKHFANKKAFTQFWKTCPQVQAILREISDGELKVQELFDVLQRALVMNVNARITSAELITHPIFE